MLRSSYTILAALVVSYACTLASDAIFGMVAVPEGDQRALPVLVLTIVVYFLGIALAGWCAGVFAGHAEVTHAGVMGLLRLLISIAIAAEIHGDAPEWWIVTRLLLVLPAALAGGAVRAFQRLPQEA